MAAVLHCPVLLLPCVPLSIETSAEPAEEITVTKRLLARHNLLLRRHRALARTLARTRVRMRSLTVHREIAPVTKASVTLDFNEPANIHLHFFAKIAFDPAFGLDGLAQLIDLLFREVLDFLNVIDIGLHANRPRAFLPDAINRGQAHP